ncbi:hypothetical protein [Providencia sp. PROV197]|uniref:hypothetical protein n=1 Tax=Providencia sp. PROV197 TaxID=2949898 RepID=UPI0023491AA9|nr:hypothetical protein [Providencia sp. PROV197]
MNNKSTSLANNDNEQEYVFPAKDMRSQQILMGVIFIAVGVFTLDMGSRGIPIGFGVICFI